MGNSTIVENITTHGRHICVNEGKLHLSESDRNRHNKSTVLLQIKFSK
jgi:hypothetical protein